MRVQLPDFVTFPVWPEPGVAWVHENDITTVSQWIPGKRVFCRHRFDGTFYHLSYGTTQIRTRAVMCRPVRYEGFQMGDMVEVVALAMRRPPRVGRISNMEYDRHSGRILYRISAAGLRSISTEYFSDELRNLNPKHLPAYAYSRVS